MTEEIRLKQVLIEATWLAYEKHAGQEDKAGMPYIHHPIIVMSRVNTTKEKIAAILHDVLEDTDATEDDLRAIGVPEDVIEAVKALSRLPDESYGEFIKRAAQNEIARPVKREDMVHNSDITRILEPTDYDYRRTKKYQKWIKYLSELT